MLYSVQMIPHKDPWRGPRGSALRMQGAVAMGGASCMNHAVASQSLDVRHEGALEGSVTGQKAVGLSPPTRMRTGLRRKAGYCRDKRIES